MGDHKNTILAIVLSLIVVVGWQYFVGYPQMEKQREQALSSSSRNRRKPNPARRSRIRRNPAPRLVQDTRLRHAAAGARHRRARGRNRIARRGDCRFAAHRHRHADAARQHRSQRRPHRRSRARAISRDHRSNSPAIVLFSPSGAPEAFYAEFGWVAAAGTTAAMPGPDTVWKQEGSGALGIDHPVTLTYDNGAGLIFRRTIAVDDRYLFTLKDQVQNKGERPGHAVSLCAGVAPRHAEGAGLLHFA